MRSLVSGCSRCGCWLLLTLALVLAILIALIALVQRAAAQAPELEIIPLVPPLEARPSTGPLPRTFYEGEIRVNYCGGRAWLAGAPDLGPRNLRTDDEVVLSSLSVGGNGAETARELVLNFQSPDRSRIIAKAGPAEVTALFPPPIVGTEVRLRVRLVDRTPPEYSSGPYWLILERRCTPSPTPTERAQVTPAAPTAPASPAPVTATRQPATPTQAAPALAPSAPPLGYGPAGPEVKWPEVTGAPGLGPVAVALLGVGLIAGGIAWIALSGRSEGAEPLNLYRFGILDLFDRETPEARTDLLSHYPQGAVLTRRPLGVVAPGAARPDNAFAHILPDAGGALLQEIGPDGQPALAPVLLEPGRSYLLAGGRVELHYRNPFQKRKGDQRQ